LAIFNTDISQGSVVTHLRCGGIVNAAFVVNLPVSCQWKNFENQSTFDEVIGNIIVACFLLTHSVYALEGPKCRYHKYQYSTVSYSMVISTSNLMEIVIMGGDTYDALYRSVD